VAVALLVLPAARAAGQHRFTVVAGTGFGGASGLAFGPPALSNAASVAFVATLADDTTVLYRYVGGVLTPVARTAATVSPFGFVSI
jgi:hypothetical protein